MWVKEAFRIGRVQYGPGSTLGPRDSLGFEFVRNTKGNIVWTFNGQRHELGPGSIILSQPNARESYEWDSHGLTQHDYIHFYIKDLPTDVPPPSEWARTAQISSGNILHYLFQHIIDLQRSAHPEAQRLIEETLQHILQIWVYDLHEFEQRGFRDFSLPIQQVLDMVHLRWQRQIMRPPALDIIIERSGVSRSSIIRAFRKVFDESPSQFFEHQCLRFGALLLLETNRSIENIAETLGYHNPFHFSKNFKQFFGLSPRSFRNAPPQQEQGNFASRHVFEILSSTQTI